MQWKNVVSRTHSLFADRSELAFCVAELQLRNRTRSLKLQFTATFQPWEKSHPLAHARASKKKRETEREKQISETITQWEESPRWSSRDRDYFPRLTLDESGDRLINPIDKSHCSLCHCVTQLYHRATAYHRIIGMQRSRDSTLPLHPIGCIRCKGKGEESEGEKKEIEKERGEKDRGRETNWSARDRERERKSARDCSPMQPTARLAAAASPHLCTSTHAISISPRPPDTSPHLTSPHLTTPLVWWTRAWTRSAAWRRVGTGRCWCPRFGEAGIVGGGDGDGAGGGDAEL